MATENEMIAVIDGVYDNRTVFKILRDTPRMYSNIVKNILWYAMRDAEDSGLHYNGYNGVYVKDKLCTYWLVGNYTVTYLTDGSDFNTDMLTEEMMNDLIIEEY